MTYSTSRPPPLIKRPCPAQHAAPSRPAVNLASSARSASVSIDGGQTMSTKRFRLALALALLTGACTPVTSYTEAEAPKALKLDSATTQFAVRFAPRTASLTPGEAARLRQLAASGAIAAADRVAIAAAGDPYLAEQRVAAVSDELLHYGIVSYGEKLGRVPPNGALIEVNRTLVTLP